MISTGITVGMMQFGNKVLADSAIYNDMSVDPGGTQTGTRSLFCFALLTFVLPTVAACNYFLNQFFVTGAAMADTGWFAYMFTHSLNWPPQNPPVIGGTWFATHFTPVFFALSAFHELLGYVGINLPSPIYFSVILGALFGAIPLAIFLLLSTGEPRTIIYLFLMSMIAIICGFNAISLAAIFLPHIEIGISAFLLIFFSLYCNSYKRTSLLALAAGLSIREDAGLHYFGFLFCLSCALYFTSPFSAARTSAKELLVLALCCLLYAVGAILLQKSLFSGDDALARVYLGDPAYEHLSWGFLKDRSFFILHNRVYILAPLLVLLVGCAALRDKILFVGAFAVIPWLAFSFAAISFQAGTLTYYYAFPIIVSVLWPAVCARITHSLGLITARQFVYRVALLLVAAISSLLFSGQIPPKAQLAVPGFGFDWYGKVTNNQSAFQRFISQNGHYRFIVDDSVASINADLVTSQQWKYRMSFSSASLAVVDGVIFQPGAWLASRAERIAADVKFVNKCEIDDSNFVVLSRHKELAQCD